MNLGDQITLYPGDCLAILPTLAPDSIDACVTDPPYHLTSIVKRFGKNDSAPAQFGKDGAFARSSRGFMGKQWDGGEIAFEPETWAAIYRVLKPGAHLCAFGAPKNFGFMQYAISQAGFEIRDVLAWLFGSGFPKSHDVSKGIDRAAGAHREIIAISQYAANRQADIGYGGGSEFEGQRGITAPATDAAREWQGWGTALKPAYEPIILARKPLSEGTVAANVLKWGTGAINIDGCRVGEGVLRDTGNLKGSREYGFGMKNRMIGGSELGRWPANVIHDGSEEVMAGFPETIVAGSSDKRGGCDYFLGGDKREHAAGAAPTESGSAARFFYTAKADSDDRLGSKHPTVKPLDLMQYLVRLVTPPKGLVLDPFAGTGTTGEACIREGMRAILIEREEEYLADIQRRMKLAMAGPDERGREAIKAKLKDKPADHGPLFAVQDP